MLVSDFDYELPPELIAQHPPAERGQSRLLVIPRDGGPLEHRRFGDLPEYLRADDCLVLNDTKVLPARLVGRRASGGQVELLLLRPVGEGLWEALGRPARRLRVGERVKFGPELAAQIVAVGGEGLRTVRLEHEGELLPVLERVGQMPLPPYIRRDHPEADDATRYQTVYAERPGAVAAPTAGLHFTEELLQRIAEQGVSMARLTLHVGLGTFRPISVERLEEHVMHAEWYRVPPEAADAINAARAAGGRIVAVGTTVVRTLESVADEAGVVHPGEGSTNLFITPGFRFRVVDALLTNFHLPRSTLLVLVSAFAGRERILAAYQEAIAAGYRFYSYGDATLLV
ncbi:MAG: tRNA preQ1(34) S-adenosylmethionine ribosyltransferase-isomerase QueA [Armatimonadetes bacterium]|nr:tRNA preQ1(34) S-adenosylmethionine ribosyltransferase-isomerase QueA [Armatimonadota bacterium]